MTDQTQSTRPDDVTTQNDVTAQDPDPRDETETVAYSPAPEPRPEWARSAWLENPPAPERPADQGTPADGYAYPRTPVEPVAPAGAPPPGSTANAPTAWTPEPGPQLQPIQPVPAVQVQRGRGGSGFGPVVAAAMLSAVLASGGTVLVLQSTGALDRQPAAPGASQPAAAGTQKPAPPDDSSAVVNAAATVSPAVVRIFAEGVSTDIFGGQIPQSGVGSGVIFDGAGWILTNRHVVETGDGDTASELVVELKDGREFRGVVYGIDTLTDLAIVKITAEDLPAAPIGRSADIKVGQLAIAIGSPLGTYTGTVTTGIISATGRTVDVESSARLTNLIQTDAAINPGNSGGPLLDAGGTVIGINTAVERDSTGIGFAIPIDIARPIMAQALAGQPLARPFVGIRYQSIDAKLKADANLPVDRGALIGPSTDPAGGPIPAIEPGSPADAAGLRDGDIITAIEDQLIDAEHPLDAVLTSYAPGQTVTLKILREGQELDLEVTLGTRPDGL